MKEIIIFLGIVGVFIILVEYKFGYLDLLGKKKSFNFVVVLSNGGSKWMLLYSVFLWCEGRKGWDVCVYFF